MTRYFFDLCSDAGTAADEIGTELPDPLAALEYGYQVARELARNNSSKSRTLCISVRDESGRVLSNVPLADVDEAICQLHPRSRALLRTCFERRRTLSDAVRAAREEIRLSRASVARSRGKPYLAAADGKRYR
jgi:hypothetical protein